MTRCDRCNKWPCRYSQYEIKFNPKLTKSISEPTLDANSNKDNINQNQPKRLARELSKSLSHLTGPVLVEQSLCTRCFIQTQNKHLSLIM